MIALPTPPRGTPSRGARAFTLVEMVVSIALLSIVGTALMSGFLLSLRAIPEQGDPGLAAPQLDAALEFMLADAAVARRVSIPDAGRLVLEVADVTGDDAPDRVAYELENDAASSTPLLRTVNNGSARTLATGVASLEFALDEAMGTDSRVVVTITTAAGGVHRAGLELLARPPSE